MKEENILREKSLKFGIRIVKMTNHLIRTNSVAVHPIFTQALKAGTSVGANICEAEYGESMEDFRHKLKIALKEASETEYWIEIFHHSDFIDSAQYESIITDCKEIIKLLTASINTINNK